MTQNAEQVKEKAAELQAKIDANTDAFRETAQANEDNFNAQMENMMGKIKAGLPPLDMNLVAGKGTDLNGDLLEPSSFELSLETEGLVESFIIIKVSNQI